MSETITPPRRGWRSRVPGWKFWVFTPLVVVALGIVGFGVVYALTDVPDANAEATSQTTIVYWDDGETELGRLSEQNRTSVALGRMPLALQQATLAAEDRDFYSHRGVSPTGIGRAVWNNLRGGDVQGGSTITQQLAKNLYLTQERTFTRKFTELVLAIKLENTYSKDQILEDYLNTIYLGRSAYGVQTAARQYFDKDVDELSVAESAVLAAIIRSPGSYSPDEFPERLESRWNYVLDVMVEEGWLSQAERAEQEFPEIRQSVPANSLGGPNGYLIETARLELVELGFSEEEILRGGLRVRTTFDRDAQAAAVTAVEEQRPETNADGVRVGLAAVEPGTGNVRALYGGEDYVQRPFNDATQATVEAGSTFKPFGLIAGLEADKSLFSRFSGRSPRTFELDGGEEYRVTNFGDVSYGRITLLKATEDSVNTAYVELGLDVGPDKVVEVARRAGVPESVQIDAEPSVVLGPAAPTALDMAGAYSTFAADGVQADPRTVLEVRAANGSVRYEAEDDTETAFEPDVMADLNIALQRVVTRGSGFRADELGRPSAGKTGTSQENKSAWYVGYTPQLATAVTLFRPDENGNPTSLRGVGGRATVTGGSFPAAIWTEFMGEALADEPVLEFTEPEPERNDGGGDQPAPAPAPAPSEEPSPTEEPTPSEEPTPTAPPTPTEEPTPTTPPTPTAPPTPTTPPSPPKPTSSPGGGGGGGAPPGG